LSKIKDGTIRRESYGKTRDENTEKEVQHEEEIPSKEWELKFFKLLRVEDDYVFKKFPGMTLILSVGICLFTVRLYFSIKLCRLSDCH
jgi:hypothetical protein